jgi:hypothetical protein
MFAGRARSATSSQLADPLPRRRYLLDRIGRLHALDPRDLSQRAQPLRAPLAQRSLAPLRPVDAAQRHRDGSAHHADLAVKGSKGVHGKCGWHERTTHYTPLNVALSQ